MNIFDILHEAKNLLTHNSIKVFKYEDCYVQLSSESMYQVLSRVDRDVIEHGQLYRHYEINGVIYESTWTNDHEAIIPKSKGYEQLSLF